MGIVQAGNVLVPLITIPFLTRTLGAEAFGQVAFAQIAANFLIILVEFGFSWSATRKVAESRYNPKQLSAIFIGTWCAQWFLLVPACFIAFAALAFVDRVSIDATLNIWALLTVLGTVMFPAWFLQGLEKITFLAGSQLVFRCASLLAILLFVRDPADAYLVLVFNGLVPICCGVVFLWWLIRNRTVTWSSPNLHMVGQELSAGWALFSSRVAISLYTVAVPLILGWISGPVALAHFNLADRLRLAAQSLLNPLSYAIYPRISALLAGHNRSAAATLLRKSLLAFSLVSGVASFALFILADVMTTVVGGPGFEPAADALRLLALCPLLVALSNLCGVQILVASGQGRMVARTSILVAIVSLTIGQLLIRWGGQTGAALTIVFAETVVTLVYGFYAFKLYRTW